MKRGRLEGGGVKGGTLRNTEPLLMTRLHGSLVISRVADSDLIQIRYQTLNFYLDLNICFEEINLSLCLNPLRTFSRKKHCSIYKILWFIQTGLNFNFDVSVQIPSVCVKTDLQR